jgi:DNA-binding transcriptional ArsR family regulator
MAFAVGCGGARGANGPPGVGKTPAGSTMPTLKEAHAEAKWFAALGTPARLAILRALAKGEKSMKELAVLQRLDYHSVRPAIKTLESVGLIYTQMEGTNRRCKLLNAVVNKETIELTSPSGARVVLPL